MLVLSELPSFSRVFVEYMASFCQVETFGLDEYSPSRSLQTMSARDEYWPLRVKTMNEVVVDLLYSSHS